MYKTIEYLQKKPDHHKQTIVLVSSLGITLVIFTIWLSFISVEYATIDVPKEVANSKSPLVVIKENVANVYNSIKSDLGRIKYQAPQ